MPPTTVGGILRNAQQEAVKIWYTSLMSKYKKQIYNIIQIGNKEDRPSKVFDYVIVISIIINLAVTLMATFNELEPLYGLFAVLEWITAVIFTVEYVLRVWTADMIFPDKKPWVSRLLFIISIFGLIDLFAILPTYLPVFFPQGAVAFRMFRVIRVFRLFKINSQYDAFNVIIDVIKDKKNQLFSSLCMILILIIASSLCMYSVENRVQPENFQNAFSGVWWATSTLLTVGYGDIYPITTVGKFLAMIVSFLGVAMVAIPTGIISAGFVEQYTKIKLLASSEEKKVNLVTSVITEGHEWIGKAVKDITLPPQLLLVMILRDDNVVAAKGKTILQVHDRLVIAAKNFEGEKDVDLREVLIKNDNPWVSKPIKDLDFSRQEMIISIERLGKTIIPSGQTVIHSGDKILIYDRRGEE